jgi:cytochrome d ubiquinol oxidase subunit II
MMTHGAIYLLLKTEGKLYDRLTVLVKHGIIAFIVVFAITTLYTLIYIPHLSDKFQNNPEFFIVPLAAFLSIANIPRLISKKKFMPAFLFSSLTICLLLVIVAIEVYPTMLFSTVDPKYNIDIYNAASSTKSLKIMLTMVAIGGPLVLSYTIFVYRTFKGKVKLDEHSY